MMMALGLFMFGMNTAAYQTLERQTSWRHAQSSRVGARAAFQYLGVGDETITLPGWLAPGQMGMAASISFLRNMGDTGKAFTLVDGLGFFHGVYVITNLTESQSVHNKFGQARRIEFSVSLTRIDEDKADAFLGDLKLPSHVLL